jgi:hypothetical protein
LKVFLDSSILRHAVTHFGAVRQTSVDWGGRSFPVELHTSQPRTPRDPWLEKQIDAIGLLAGVARHGRLKLYISTELRMEAMGSGRGILPFSEASLFAGIPITHVAPPFQYSRLIVAWDDPKGRAKERTTKFFADASDSLLDSLRRVLGKENSADAFHILTAERADIAVFLTTDKRLRNSTTRLKPNTLRVKVLLPAELIELIADPA